MCVRRSSLFLSFVMLLVLALASLAGHAFLRAGDAARDLTERRELVKYLNLTDLVLFTDARYTRHPAMADVHAAFQDHPLSVEHFPSGSLLPPPGHLRNHGKH